MLRSTLVTTEQRRRSYYFIRSSLHNANLSKQPVHCLTVLQDGHKFSGTRSNSLSRPMKPLADPQDLCTSK